jgi:hypothetical protein
VPSSQDVEAQALLTALKSQWSEECEALLKERERASTQSFKQELSSYRAEVRLFCLMPA